MNITKSQMKPRLTWYNSSAEKGLTRQVSAVHLFSTQLFKI